MTLTWKQFKKRYGTTTTTNVQLTEWANELGIPNFSCIMRDELQHLDKTQPHNIIINLQTSKDRGTDWSCLYTEPPSTAYYFSSYALPPLKEVKSFTDNCRERYHNTYQLQELGQSYCGQISLYVLYRLSRNDDFENIILQFIK